MKTRPIMCLILFFTFLICQFWTPNLTELNVNLVALEHEISSIDTFDITKYHKRIVKNIDFFFFTAESEGNSMFLN